MAVKILPDGTEVDILLDEQENPDINTLAHVKEIYRITKEMEEAPYTKSIFIEQSDIDAEPSKYYSGSLGLAKQHELYDGDPAVAGVLYKTLVMTYPSQNVMTTLVVKP